MRPALVLSFALAFLAGIAVSPLIQHLAPSAHAQTLNQKPSSAQTSAQPMIIDIAALTDADLSVTANPDLRARSFVATPQATLSVQTGNVAKHYHANADKIQYIVEGIGTEWLGDQKHEIRPGMLIIIPRGTLHAGSEAISGRFNHLTS